MDLMAPRVQQTGLLVDSFCVATVEEIKLPTCLAHCCSRGYNLVSNRLPLNGTLVCLRYKEAGNVMGID